MTSVASAPRAAGHGHLRVEAVAGQSAAVASEANSPLKILIPHPRGQSVWAYFSNFGGGLLPGDEIEVAIDIGQSARCFLGTQSSTKIFRGGPKGSVNNHLTAQIAPGALLVYAPDPAQGFADSRYRQRQTIHLADESSSLIFLDWYSAGRSARGERWAFSEYSSRTEIRITDRLAFLDSIHLATDSDFISLPDRMGRANCLATIAIFGEPLQRPARAWLDQIATTPITKRADALMVASPIAGGIVIRAAGISVEAVAREIFPALSFIAPFLGDNPFLRKW
jgi:urease accessory protein